MLSASSPTPKKLPFIDFARGLSIFGVTLFHTLEHVPLPPSVAQATQISGGSIYIFMFVSSYGLYFSRITSWKAFYKKRFKLVLLPYYIGLTLIFILNQFIHLYDSSWPAYLSHVFLYKMFNESYVQTFGPQFWFMSTIIQFYVLFPLLLMLINRLPTPRLLTIAFAVSLLHGLLIVKLGVYQQRIWYSSVIQYLWVFVLGLAAAKHQWLPQLVKLGLLRYGLLLATGLASIFAINFFAGEKGNVFNDYFMFLSYFSIGCTLYWLGQRIPVIVRFFSWIKTFSYSLYITHYFVLALYMKVLLRTQVSLYELPIIVAACLGVAIVFNRFVRWVTDLLFTPTQPALGGV